MPLLKRTFDSISTIMKKAIKITGFALLAALIIIQFIHPARNQSTVITANDISNVFPVPDSVKTILVKACYDCHSNNTRYPWYSSLQPADWWLNDHIKDGKKELNFSEFGSYKLLKQAKRLKKSAKEVDEGEMPLDSYLWIHKDAVLTPVEKKTFMTWANDLSAQLFAKVPPEEIAEDKRQHDARKKAQEKK